MWPSIFLTVVGTTPPTSCRGSSPQPSPSRGSRDVVLGDRALTRYDFTTVRKWRISPPLPFASSVTESGVT